MLGYIALALLLAVVIPTLCFFSGLMELYLQYGAPVSGLILLLWLLLDVLQMRRRKIRIKRVRR